MSEHSDSDSRAKLVCVSRGSSSRMWKTRTLAISQECEPLQISMVILIAEGVLQECGKHISESAAITITVHSKKVAICHTD